MGHPWAQPQRLSSAHLSRIRGPQRPDPFSVISDAGRETEVRDCYYLWNCRKMWLLEGSFGGSILKPCRDAPALDEPPSVGILFLSSPGWPLICALTVEDLKSVQPRATWKLVVFIHTLIDQTFLTWLSDSSQCLRIYFPRGKIMQQSFLHLRIFM